MPRNNIPPPSSYMSKGRHHGSSKFSGESKATEHRNTHNKQVKHNQSLHFSSNSRYQQFQSRKAGDQTDKFATKLDMPKDKLHRNDDDDYFATVQDDDDEAGPTTDVSGKCGETSIDDDEDDPLDAYMKSLEETNEIQSTSKTLDDFRSNSLSIGSESKSCSHSNPEKGIRLDIDGADDAEEFLTQIESSFRNTPELRDGTAGDSQDDDERDQMVEYDKYDNILSVKRSKKEVDPLPTIDHSTISYDKFQRDFYKEHPEIVKLNPEKSEELRTKLEIKVSGQSPPKPVCSFAHFNFDERLMKVIRRSEYTQPTPIQAQAIPAALLGRNIIGIALTGSGKTAAYLWPMIVHIMGQPNLKKGDGPIGLILVPTRELALQVYGQAKKFSHSYKIAVVCAYGGGSKYEQSKDLEAGAEIVVATPGRLIDLIKLGVTNLRRVTYLVLDEADRFFEMGFEVQVRSICDHVRPDRQTLLFSATFKSKTEHLARKIVDDPIKIVQKNLGEANEDVKQHVVTFSEAAKKWNWLVNKMVEFTSSGSVLIFVTRIANSEELHKNLKNHGKETLLMHGDMDQSERNRVITSFKRKEMDIMIATDVAARGLDISHIKTVINFDVARDIDTHIHRVGRTGRAGLKGDAYTLITDKDRDFAGHLVKNLESSHQEVTEDLMKIAMQSHAFRKSRLAKHKKPHQYPNKRPYSNYDRSSHHSNDDHQHSHQYQSRGLLNEGHLKRNKLL